jgi:hypothetical protein
MLISGGGGYSLMRTVLRSWRGNDRLRYQHYGFLWYASMQSGL